MGISKNDYVIMICNKCFFITYGKYSKAQQYMLYHLVKKHRVRGTKVSDFRDYYTTLRISPELYRNIIDNKVFKTTLFNSLRKTLKYALRT